ncbi:Kef-type K+ transport system, membrane component KefB [Cyclobacterium lianum]|uniref:Kef-type K+ transport system, membrane component KefB n=1 Tax=Cyclobacterium lianum TaxID=388280 RepID=A0A1M7M180_9BACT|nr:cation:proton antiporter [Cyclobacterium lianum]SHM83910.1 Kef-type K+ transport system, membrane component KefB [Cyclobacterium lianum]
MESFRNQLAHEFELPLANPILVFSLILLIILLAPVILRKFNVPGIIGLILAGVLVGPYGLNFLEKSSAIELLSTIGLLYIMFVAGLELDLNEFKSHRNSSLLFGLFTFLLPLGIGFPVCYYVLGYDPNASFLTASMFSTHTLVAYPIVSALGIAKNRAVAVTVGGTILTDTAVLIILAVVIGKSEAGLGAGFWLKLGISIVIFSSIVLVLIPKFARWFFRKLESEKHSHYILVLSMVFLAAFLAELAGLEPIIGAFLAGLGLNKLIPHSSALMNRIEFIGNSLFIPFFLISVGMLVDITVIFSGPMALLIAGTLSGVALFGKWLSAWFTQQILNYTAIERQLIFGLSAGHTAATLAVILVGYRAGILDENILNGTVVLILITCLVSSLATERAAKQLVIAKENANSVLSENQPERPETILLPFANIENIEKLLEFTIFIKDKKSIEPISILSVVENNEEAEINLIKARKKLEEFVSQAAAFDTAVNIITTLDLNPASGISRVSREIMADTIVLGWPRKSGLIQRLFGQKMDAIVANTDRTIFICHLESPLMLHHRISVFVPAWAEKEVGFTDWFAKLGRLATELSAVIHFYCTGSTCKALQLLVRSSALDALLTNQPVSDWEHFKQQFQHMDSDELVVLVAARRGTASYIPLMENIPEKMESLVPENNMLIIYPGKSLTGTETEKFDGISVN